jgi:hypothetical protein
MVKHPNVYGNVILSGRVPGVDHVKFMMKLGGGKSDIRTYDNIHMHILK